MFWQRLAGSAYHVLVAQPALLPTATFDVSAGHGVYLPAGALIAGSLHTAVPMGLVDSQWFFNAFHSSREQSFRFGNLSAAAQPQRVPEL
jgi:hypothetical protein